MKIDECGGHFDQMMRQTRAHHALLSQVADQKANMLTTVSALAATILFSMVNTSTTLRIPATMMLVTCVTTCCFAVLASMPGMKRPRGNIREKNPLFNPLFFGDFVGLSYDEYKKEMERVLSSHEETYEAQVREVYAMGKYLAARKFLYLRRAYICLFVGLVASALVWLTLQLEEAGIIDVLN